MLSGTNKVTNAIALAVEAALPYPTSPRDGWRRVTPGRKDICRDAASRAVLYLDEAGYQIVKKK